MGGTWRCWHEPPPVLDTSLTWAAALHGMPSISTSFSSSSCTAVARMGTLRGDSAISKQGFARPPCPGHTPACPPDVPTLLPGSRCLTKSSEEAPSADPRTYRWCSVLGPKLSLTLRCRWMARWGMRRTGRSTCTRRCSRRPVLGSWNTQSAAGPPCGAVGAAAGPAGGEGTHPSHHPRARAHLHDHPACHREVAVEPGVPDAPAVGLHSDLHRAHLAPLGAPLHLGEGRDVTGTATPRGGLGESSPFAHQTRPGAAGARSPGGRGCRCAPRAG